MNMNRRHSTTTYELHKKKMRKSSGGGFFTKLTPTRKVVRKSASKQDLRNLGDKITLGKVLGLTTTNTNGLTCNPTTGVVAYPAGCVIVVYDPKTNLQRHIFNPDKKTITCVAFSSDGKYLVSGESGQQPSVRVWELNESINQVAELRGHKSGITSVEFSPNQKLLVSIGDQHDMLVNVWNWKQGHTVACNKSGCRNGILHEKGTSQNVDVKVQVRAVSFSEDGNYLVTVGNRHVKFWYLDTEASSKGNAPITPINGRSGILGDQRNNCFTDVMCGRGRSKKYTYCVTKSGLLCMFGEKRVLDKWVELKSGCTNCLVVTERYIFCGCSNGIIRVFEPITLRYIATLPKPHNLGVNVSDGVNPSDLIGDSSVRNCPDLVAINIDKQRLKLSVVYNDHSLYIWDVHDVKKVGKVASFLYHSACIWGVETYPYFEDNSSTCLPYGSFLTCSSDDTIRIWNLETGEHNKAYPRNLYSKDLLKVVYIDEGLANLQDTSMVPFSKDSDSKNGVRCMQISPDGQVIATGDRNGNLRIYDMQFFDILITIEAHEAEILCVEFSLPESGYCLLASSSRDRLVHIFDVKNDYALLQTIDDHSSSITAVRFNFDMGTLQLLSCGADKVVMFHTAQNDGGAVTFIRNTIVPGKSTLYDMGIEPTRKHAATVGQDRNLRVYDIQGAKQINSYKGSPNDEGNLIKFQLDGGGVYAAISCSDKTIALFDFQSGDCEAAIYGHSELVTGLKFTGDGKHMISVSGDGCIFTWNLPTTFTEADPLVFKTVTDQNKVMSFHGKAVLSQHVDVKNQNILNRMHELNIPIPSGDDQNDTRRKTFIVSANHSPLHNEFTNGSEVIENSPAKGPLGYRFSVGQLPMWAQKQIGAGDNNTENKGSSQPLGRWGERDTGLSTVPEQLANRDGRLSSHDSSTSMSSEKMFDEEPSGEVVYPTSTDDNGANEEENERFHNRYLWRFPGKTVLSKGVNVKIQEKDTSQDVDVKNQLRGAVFRRKGPGTDVKLAIDSTLTFHVTETKRHHKLSTTYKHTHQIKCDRPWEKDAFQDVDVKFQDARNSELLNGDGGELDQASSSESLPDDEEDMESSSSDLHGTEDEADEDDDDDDAFSPLNDHFEKLATPVAQKMLARERSESNPIERGVNSALASATTNSVTLPGGHRASISAKFLSRSQRSGRSSASTVSAEEQRKRIEALKARINSNSNSSTTATNNSITSSNTNQTKPFDRETSSSSSRFSSSSSNKIFYQHQRSVDSSEMSPQNKARVITNNLKKNKLISKSCQNLSFTFNGEIPTSPTLHHKELINYDPRRSSTPLNKNPPKGDDDKYKRRSTSNVWTRNVMSPVSSPVKEKASSKTNLRPTDVTKLTSSPSRTRRSLDTQATSTNAEVVRRKNVKKERNRRPRSMIIPSSTFKDVRQPFEIDDQIEPLHSKQEIQRNTFESNTTVSNVKSPTRKIACNINLDEDIPHKNVVSDNDYLPIDQETEAVNRLAAEVDDNVKNLTEQMFLNSTGGELDAEPEIEAGHSKRLIDLYETGLVNTGTESLSSAPVCDHEGERINRENSPIGHVIGTPPCGEMATPPDTLGNENDENEDTPSEVTWTRCESVMRNLIQSYNDAAQLQNTLLNEPVSDHQKSLLAVISRTYTSLENNIQLQKQQLENITDLSEHNSAYIQSDLFKELQKTLVVATQPTVQGSNAEMFSLLDKYSDVLVDIISKKMKAKETLIE